MTVLYVHALSFALTCFVCHLQLVFEGSETTFNEDFWLSLNFVTNALDNVEARKYVDGRCVLFDLPLLESGAPTVLFWHADQYPVSSTPPPFSSPIRHAGHDGEFSNHSAAQDDHVYGPPRRSAAQDPDVHAAQLPYTD